MNNRLDKQILSNENEQTMATFINMAEFHNYNVEWKKQDNFKIVITFHSWL